MIAVALLASIFLATSFLGVALGHFLPWAVALLIAAAVYLFVGLIVLRRLRAHDFPLIIWPVAAVAWVTIKRGGRR